MPINFSKRQRDSASDVVECVVSSSSSISLAYSNVAAANSPTVHLRSSSTRHTVSNCTKEEDIQKIDSESMRNISRNGGHFGVYLLWPIFRDRPYGRLILGDQQHWQPSIVSPIWVEHYHCIGNRSPNCRLQSIWCRRVLSFDFFRFVISEEVWDKFKTISHKAKYSSGHSSGIRAGFQTIAIKYLVIWNDFELASNRIGHNVKQHIDAKATSNKSDCSQIFRVFWFVLVSVWAEFRLLTCIRRIQRHNLKENNYLYNEFVIAVNGLLAFDWRNWPMQWRSFVARTIFCSFGRFGCLTVLLLVDRRIGLCGLTFTFLGKKRLCGWHLSSAA